MANTYIKDKPLNILYIPDMQQKPGVCPKFLEAVGNYIVHKRPDVIVNAGDFWDMPSLSSYDKGKKASHGRTVLEDIKAGQVAMSTMLQPVYSLQARQVANKKKVYNPKMFYLIGNHEERIDRHVNSNPELDGFLSLDDLKLPDYGWEVIPFLDTININGVLFSHYFYNPMTGRPLGGSIENRLNKIKCSFVQGHVQGLQIGTAFRPDGSQLWGIVAGSGYEHDEGYIGPQANDHWRGLIEMYNTQDGDFGHKTISTKWLKENYLCRT
jgi:hypothetical protein